jgi:hypothetical protein
MIDYKSFLKKIDTVIKQMTGLSILFLLKKFLPILKQFKAYISEKKDAILLYATTKDTIYYMGGGGYIYLYFIMILIAVKKQKGLLSALLN